MDTILSGIPMPKIFLAAEMRDGDTHRIVIDGQQRISAILDFLEDEFALDPPYSGEYAGKRFSQLPSDTTKQFLQYSIDFNEALDFTDADLREVYSRVNKYTFALTKQELRRADFPGDYLDASDRYAIHQYLQDIKLFTVANRRRQSDVEYTSELIAGLIDGPQDKKQSLDSFYQDYASWDADHRRRIEIRFDRVLSDMQCIFAQDKLPQVKTRFRQKADFYALCLAIDQLAASGHSLEGKDMQYLRQDLQYLDDGISPSSSIDLFREYAIRCVSDANSAASRIWRVQFLNEILSGTYKGEPPTGQAADRFISLAQDLFMSDDGICEPPTFQCPYCEQSESHTSSSYLAWPEEAIQFQLSNSQFVHAECHERENGRWVVPKAASPDQIQLDFSKVGDDNDPT